MTTTLELSGSKPRAGTGETPHVPLASVCDIIMGQAPAGDTYNTLGNGVALIAGAGDFSGGILAPKKFTDKPTKLSEPGDIVLSIRASIGDKVWADQVYCLGRGVAALRAKPSIDSKYLWHSMSASRQTLMGKAKGATFLQVNRSDIGELLIAVPPLDEQRRIAAILDKADELRTKRRQALVHLDALTQSIFHSTFGDQANEQHIPLRDAVASGTIVTYGIVQAGEEYPSGVPYVRTGDIRNGRIDQEGLRRTNPAIAAKFARSKIAAGDIVMSIRATVGTVALTPQELDGANLTQGTARIAPGPDTEASYLLEYLRTPRIQQWIQKQVKGATFKEITLDRLRQLPVSIPKKADQLSFGHAVSAVEKLKGHHRGQLSALDALFASLQHRAFTGGL